MSAGKDNTVHDHDHADVDTTSRAFAVGVTLNLAFVAIETGFGLWANSLSLLADAGHNFSDVIGLLAVWAAMILAKRLPSTCSRRIANSATIFRGRAALSASERLVSSHSMKELFVLVAHLLTTLAKLTQPGGARAVAAESIALKHQLLIMQRNRKRAPSMTPWDRLFVGLCSLWIAPGRRKKLAVVFRPSTFHRFHEALVRCKYRLLYTATRQGKPGPQGPSTELIAAVVEMKRRNPRFGCLKVAQQISYAFGVEVNKDVVRRILEKHHHPSSGDDGPSWLTAIGHAKDSLWSMDLFKCESIVLQSFWVMVIIDVFTRRFVGFAVERGNIDGAAVCRMFNAAMAKLDPPKYLSSDNDPLFRFHRWRANLRVMDIEEVKSLPFVPRSHPFVERLIRTIREELLDRVLFWNQLDLERKLSAFRGYYNQNRVHSGIDGTPPDERGGQCQRGILPLSDFGWRPHCHDLFQLPTSA